LLAVLVLFAETRDKCIWRLAWQPSGYIYMLCKLMWHVYYM